RQAEREGLRGQRIGGAGEQEQIEAVAQHHLRAEQQQHDAGDVGGDLVERQGGADLRVRSGEAALGRALGRGGTVGSVVCHVDYLVAWGVLLGVVWSAPSGSA